MLKKLVFKIDLVLDVPKGVKLPRLTERFRKFWALVNLKDIFHL
jgi:hypothetical protein